MDLADLTPGTRVLIPAVVHGIVGGRATGQNVTVKVRDESGTGEDTPIVPINARLLRADPDASPE